jgi:hypothetical protein
VPLQFSAIGHHVPEINIKELFGRSYVYWTPLDWLALGVEYQYDNIEVHGDIFDASTSPVEKIAIHRVPLEARIFLPAGVFARLRGTYVYEQVRLADFDTGVPMKNSDSFVVLDAALGYRFPKRFGLVTIEVSNLLDQQFHFMDVDPTNSTISNDERVVLGRLTLTF